MDLRVYYQKIRELEAELPEPCVVVSRTTESGGKEGMRTEVPRRLGARMIVEGHARAATEEEAREFRGKQAAAKEAAEQIAAAARMQVTVVPSSEWKNLRAPRARE